MRSVRLVCAAALVLVLMAAVGCALAGRYVGVPGGTGAYEWVENGQVQGRVRFWPHGELTADFGALGRDGGTWGWGGGGVLLVLPAGEGAEPLSFWKQDSGEFVQVGGTARLVPAGARKQTSAL